jgi:hypothetical protein
VAKDMNMKVVLIAFVIALLVFFASFLLLKNEYTSDILKAGTGYALFEISEIELSSNATIGDTTYTLHGSPFWYFKSTNGAVASASISILPLIIDFMIVFGLCLLVVYSLYKSKFKRMLTFKKKHRGEPIPYERVWNYVEPGYYYDPHLIEGYNYENIYLRRKKRKSKKKRKVVRK